MVKYLDVRIDLGAETGSEAQASVQALHERLVAIQERIKEVSVETKSVQLIKLLLDESTLLIELKRMSDAWGSARKAFDLSITEKMWEHAARACDLLFRTGLKNSLPALGQGIWLAVTFPVDPELTVSLLNHVIEETPDHSDGAAVAAITAVYVAGLRAEGSQYDDLSVNTRQMLTTVGRRHGGIENQIDLERWLDHLELNEPKQFLGRLRSIVDFLIQDEWWFDWKAVQAEIPDQ